MTVLKRPGTGSKVTFTVSFWVKKKKKKPRWKWKTAPLAAWIETLTYKTRLTGRRNKCRGDTLEVIPDLSDRGCGHWHGLLEGNGPGMSACGINYGRVMSFIWPVCAELWHYKGKKKIKEAALSLLQYESMFFVKANLIKRSLFYIKGGGSVTNSNYICWNPRAGLDWRTGSREVSCDVTPIRKASCPCLLFFQWQPWRKIQFSLNHSPLIMLMQTEWWLGRERGLIPEEDQSRLL